MHMVYPDPLTVKAKVANIVCPGETQNAMVLVVVGVGADVGVGVGVVVVGDLATLRPPQIPACLGSCVVGAHTCHTAHMLAHDKHTRGWTKSCTT